MATVATVRSLLALTSFPAFWSPAIAADLAVLVDGPARPAIVLVADEFKRSTGHRLTFVFAPGPALNKRIIDGERADAVIIPMRYVEELQLAAKAKVADAKSVGGAGFSLAVRKGGTVFDVSNVNELRSSLLKADAVVFNNVGSGNYFATVIERLSLSQAIGEKIVRLGPSEVFDRVANSNAAEIAVGTTPLVLEDNRLQSLGELPPEFQSRLELFAVPLSASSDRGATDALIAYLTTQDTKRRLAAAGLK
ncbi:MAG: molybdate ABC transporter substrate-binding protein [Hyphomicrobiaceae bacterium]